MQNNFFNNKLNSNKEYTFEKNDIIFNEGDKCEYVGYVVSGQAIISTSSALYNEFVITVLNPGDTFGENLLFSNNPFYLGSIYANKKTTIKLISKNEYLDLISNNLNDFLKFNSNKFLMLQQKTKILLQKTIREKILFYLISKSNILKTNIIPIKSKKDLSAYLNIERPSLSRELINLKNDKIINYDKHYIEILKKLD